MTIPEAVLELLSDGKKRPLHEISEEIKARFGVCANDATISARTRRELRDRLDSERPEGKNYKVWFLKQPVTIPGLIFNGDQVEIELQ